MKQYLPILFTFFLLTSCSSNRITIGEIEQVKSETLDELRDIWVHLPSSAKEPGNQNKKYPVLYLLDGDAHFYSVTGIIRQLSSVNGNSICPEMIVVGIPNTDRFRDLSPTHVDVIFGDSTMAQSSGGGGRFLDFLEQELIPHIESKYPASSYRTFVGHSPGGLMVVHALFNRPKLFHNYIDLDPSLWWDVQALLKTADAVLSQEELQNRTLYIGVANTMPKGMQLDELEEDVSEETMHIRSMLELAKTIEADQESELTFAWKYYEDDDHGSVPLIAEYDAIRFLFPWYEFKELNQFFSPASSAEDLVKAINKHSEVVSTHYGYLVSPDEDLVNSLGYRFMGGGMSEKSFAMFNLNILNYPKSSNVYDSMGDYYLSQANVEKAAEYFQKAMEVGKNPESKKKLKQLKSKK